MKLTDLDPEFWATGGARHGMGLTLLCPICKQARLGVTFTNPIDGGPPQAGKTGWQRVGETFDVMTLSQSIQEIGGCNAHFFIRNGDIVMA